MKIVRRFDRPYFELSVWEVYLFMAMVISMSIIVMVLILDDIDQTNKAHPCVQQ